MPSCCADVVERADMGVVQAGDGPGFALEALAAFGVLATIGRQNLDRDGAVEARVVRPVDLAHAARAQGCQDLVGAESSSCSGGPCRPPSVKGGL